MLVVQERDGNNLPRVSYTRGNDLSGSLQGAGGIGGLLARTENAKLVVGSPDAHAYYHADGNGNVTCMVNTNGQVVARYHYDPYGNLLGSIGPLAEANTYRFSSKEWLANAALYYYGYRCYEPNQQRWINRDPLRETSFELRHPQFVLLAGTEANLYGYVRNHPTTTIDVLGLGMKPPKPLNFKSCLAAAKEARKCIDKLGELSADPEAVKKAKEFMKSLENISAEHARWEKEAYQECAQELTDEENLDLQHRDTANCAIGKANKQMHDTYKEQIDALEKTVAPVPPCGKAILKARQCIKKIYPVAPI